jgi:NAD-dependent SIR2 family protein deacetylase
MDDFAIKQFREVFNFRQEMARAREKIDIDLDNIEELFGLVEMSHRLGMARPETRSATLYLIAKTLDLCIKVPGQRTRIRLQVDSSDASGLDALGTEIAQKMGTGTGDPVEVHYEMDMYDFFALVLGGCLDDPAKRERRSNVVITFNYDLLLENALLRVGLRPWYGQELDQEPAGNEVPVLKLHGSANWGVCSECGQVFFPEKIARSLAEIGLLRCDKCKRRGSLQPLLVPPSWDKTDHRKTMQPVWAHAVRELKRATRICVVGYSMPESDAFFRYLITLALADNHQLERFVIVDQGRTRGGLLPTFDEVPADLTVDRKWQKLLDGIFRERRYAIFQEGIQGFLSKTGALKELRRAERIHSVANYGG